MDLTDPTWVADLFDRPEEDPLGAILAGSVPRKIRTGGFALGLHLPVRLAQHTQAVQCARWAAAS